VSVALALRVIGALTEDVDLIQLYLEAAVDMIEDYTGRSMATKTYCLDLEDFPQNFVELRRTPVLAITHLKYYTGGVLTTWVAGNYRLDLASVPARLVLTDDASMPSIDFRHDAVQITFTAGSGTRESQQDPALKLAAIQLAHHYFDNRIPIGDVKMVPLPYSLRNILGAKKVRSMTDENDR
jgi:uncharacterized phiE125 gp8 family phage protein